MRYIVEINFPQNVQISCFLPGEVQLNALYLMINDHFKANKMDQWIKFPSLHEHKTCLADICRDSGIFFVSFFSAENHTE